MIDQHRRGTGRGVADTGTTAKRRLTAGLLAAGFLGFGLITNGCAGRAGQALPPLIVDETDSQMGWPFGESGRGTVMHLARTARKTRYGWTSGNPVELGGFGATGGEETVVERQIRYLNSLWGPNGELIYYEHVGTCCPFTHFGAPLDRGVLNVYALRWEGLAEPRHLFLDGFREGEVLIPKGLTSKIPPP